MHPLQIYKPNKSDYLEIIAIWEASVRATHHFLNEEDILQYKSLIFNQYLDTVNLFCIKAEQKMLGFMGLNGDMIQMLFLHPDAIGTGLGKALLEFAINEKHCTKVDVNEQNESALSFYKHFGFIIIERYDHDAAGKPYPILSLTL